MPVVRVNGIDLYYEEHGQGEPLLLMAPTGWPGSVWDLEQVPFFARTHRVITYDQRGVGRSAKPDHEYTTALLGDDRLRDIRVPTLVIVGAEDHTGADHVAAARQMAEAIPGARYAEVAGARHLFPWEAPEPANAAMLDFLTGVAHVAS